MKTTLQRYLPTLLLGMALAFSACVKETSGFEGGDGGNVDLRNVGYLSLANLEATVEQRMEEVGTVKTRGANTDVRTYKIRILDAKGDPVEVVDRHGATTTDFAYADRPETIELPVGVYSLTVRSAETPDVAWEGDPNTPTYGATQDFAILKGLPTELRDIVCRQLSIRATVSYKDKLLATMSDDTSSELVLGNDRSLLFEGKYPERAGYLKPTEGTNNTLTLYLTTVFDGKQITRQPIHVATNAKAGEWRNIEVNLQHAEDGTIIISAEVETWVYGKPVEIDMISLATISEERIPDENDPDAPKLEWPGHSFDEPFMLNNDKFDANGYFIEPCDFTVTTPTPMTSFMVATESDNAAFRNLLNAAELTEPKDMFTVEGVARTALRSWGFPAINLNVTERTFPLKELMKVLFDYEGTHKFTMTIVNEAGLKSTFALTIIVDRSAGADPRIRWEGQDKDGNNYDIKQRYDTFEGMEVDIKATATQGVKSLIVSIEGVLAEGLGEMMPTRFDLADPEAAKAGLTATLEGFGFPTGADVTGKTELQFSISKFIPLLDSFKGDTDFRLTVIDQQGHETTEAIMLHVN
ncbi:MAG: DUF4493 domain-containing protein [Alistipes sp.]|nr:DUF4493 domain-containing protein [Alistipes sp.]